MFVHFVGYKTMTSRSAEPRRAIRRIQLEFSGTLGFKSEFSIVILPCDTD
jgi:hypothetical protein